MSSRSLLTLAAAVGALLSMTFATADDRAPRVGPGPGFDLGQSRLGITKDQQAKVQALFADTGRQMADVMDKLRKDYTQLNALYDSYDFDRNQAKAIRRDIMHQRARILQIHEASEEKIRQILTREQFQKLRAMLKEERDKRRGPWPPRPPQRDSGH